jgi:hypothetical protein
MSRTLHARAAGLALVFVLAAGAAAQTIDTVSSSDDATVDKTVSATVGSVLTIDGSGFGTAKPKIFLTDGDGKKYVLKVTAFADEQLTAEVKKAVLGELTLNVQPKGAAEPVIFESVTIEGPAIDALLDLTELEIDSIGPNGEFLISGTFFGSKKGKIFIGGKKAKVLEWLNGEIHLKMPKTLANGLWDIVLDNKLGLDESAEITMVGSDKKVGKTSLTITVGTGPDEKTIKFKYSGDPVTDVEYTPFGGAQLGDPKFIMGLTVHFNPATGEVPVTLESGKAHPGMVASFSVTKKTGPGLLDFAIGNWTLLPGSEGMTVEVKNSGGGQMGGTFEVDLPMLGVANQATAIFGDANPLHIAGTFVAEQD